MKEKLTTCFKTMSMKRHLFAGVAMLAFTLTYNGFNSVCSTWLYQKKFPED